MPKRFGDGASPLTESREDAVRIRRLVAAARRPGSIHPCRRKLRARACLGESLESCMRARFEVQQGLSSQHQRMSERRICISVPKQIQADCLRLHLLGGKTDASQFHPRRIRPLSVVTDTHGMLRSTHLVASSGCHLRPESRTNVRSLSSAASPEEDAACSTASDSHAEQDNHGRRDMSVRAVKGILHKLHRVRHGQPV